MRRRTARPHQHRDRSFWRRWAVAIAGLLLLFLAPVLAYAQGGGSDTLQLVWTAPGDDGLIGTATAYEMRAAIVPITILNWAAASVMSGAPLPLESGTVQGMTVRRLSPDTVYYFALRSVDDAGNWSGLSNVARWDWITDSAPPSTPLGISVTRIAPDVRVTWTANPDPDLYGYSVYRATASTGPFAKV